MVIRRRLYDWLGEDEYCTEQVTHCQEAAVSLLRIVGVLQAICGAVRRWGENFSDKQVVVLRRWRKKAAQSWEKLMGWQSGAFLTVPYTLSVF